MERNGDWWGGGDWKGERVFPAEAWQEADGVLNKGDGNNKVSAYKSTEAHEGWYGTQASRIWEPSPPLGLEAEGGQGCWNGTGQVWVRLSGRSYSSEEPGREGAWGANTPTSPPSADHNSHWPNTPGSQRTSAEQGRGGWDGTQQGEGEA